MFEATGVAVPNGIVRHCGNFGVLGSSPWLGTDVRMGRSVLVFENYFRDDQAVEAVRIEQFIPHFRVEVFALAVFGRAVWFDVGGAGADRYYAIWHRLRYEFAAIF